MARPKTVRRREGGHVGKSTKRCSSLTRVDSGAVLRCERIKNHKGEHNYSGVKWNDEGS